MTMTTKKKRIFVLIATVLIIATIGYSVVSACAIYANCNSSVNFVQQGPKRTDYVTHEYKGGFLNLFTYTCTIEWTYEPWAAVCTSGHIQYQYTNTYSTIHRDCIK